MGDISGLTRGGAVWVPAFVNDLDQKACIGCGRCFKVCPREVFDLVERAEAMEADDDYDDDDDDFDDDDDNNMVMSLKDPMDCIGCQACSKVCPRDCLSHSPAEIAA